MQLDFTRVLPAEPKTEFPYSNYRYARHQVQALTAAEQELIRQRREAQRHANAEQEEQEPAAVAKAGMPLNIEWKILTFLFPGMLQLIFSTAFQAEGYDKKARDMRQWTLMGFGFYALLFTVAFIL